MQIVYIYDIYLFVYWKKQYNFQIQSIFLLRSLCEWTEKLAANKYNLFEYEK